MYGRIYVLSSRGNGFPLGLCSVDPILNIAFGVLLLSSESMRKCKLCMEKCTVVRQKKKKKEKFKALH